MTWTGNGRNLATRRLRVVAAMALGISLILLLALAGTVWGAPPFVVGVLTGAALVLPIGLGWGLFVERSRWLHPVLMLNERLTAQIEGIEHGRTTSSATIGVHVPPALFELHRTIGQFDGSTPRMRRTPATAPSSPAREALTRSGLFDPPSEVDGLEGSSATFETRDMVGRLEPESLRWTEVSPRLQTFLGAGLDRLRRLSILDLLHPDDRVPAAQALRNASGKGEALGLIYRLSTLGGNRRVVELNVSTRYDAEGSVVYLRCHVTDITHRIRARRKERKRTEELQQLNRTLQLTNQALADLKDRYSDLYQNAPAMYFSLNREGHILVCNETLLKTLGYSRRELLNRPYVDLLPEELRPSFRSRFAQFLTSGRIEVESQWRTRDGRLIDVFVTAVAVRDSEGRLIHSRSVAQDITARKLLEAELRRNNERLARINDELSRKNTELDEFSYVISHDLQEPIRTLIAFSGFLKQDYADRLDDQAREFLNYLTEASTRMRTLIRDLLELSRAGQATSEFQPVSLEDVLATLRIDFAELIRSRNAEVRVLGTLPTVWGDRTRIGQLLGNLIGNGLKYNESCSPRVEVGVYVGPMPKREHRVTILIRDNGIGIDPQYHETIFQMFRRLHPRDRYEGTGAGLAICQKIARAHGGRLWVESHPGAGSTFFVDLPMVPASLNSGLPVSENNRSVSSPDSAIHVR
ncbi:sensor histidine kinase [Tautonia marina]|uniref:sensor histidine kinase n=1 Tax=Tautonia marina TaxID=2653855 RepID=UPI00137578C6|nr:PAS domain S-box protein [Tautonia marina]